jgi:hypothetical protein
LVRADQFLNCERDGFPKHLAPPWKDSEAAGKKLGDACEHFAKESAKHYPQVGKANLKLTSDRCRINVITALFQDLVEHVSANPK